MKGMSEWVKLRGEGIVRLLNLKRESLPHQTTYERLSLQYQLASFDLTNSDSFCENIVYHFIKT